VPASNKRLAGRLALAAALAAAACGDNPMIALIPVRLELTPATDTVYVGEITSPLTARAFNALDEEIPDVVITWTSSQPGVAAVDSLTGAVTGIEPGATRIAARAGSVTDTALVLVLDLIQLGLPYDTLLLAPQDTFTIPIELVVAPGRPAPVVRFRGGAPGIVTIDSLTGLARALGDGEASFVVVADSTATSGLVVVETIQDTLSGAAHLTLTGAVTLSASWISRAFNHPTNDQRTLFQLRALDPNVHEFDVLLIDSLTGPGTRLVETVPPNGLGSDPVCFPPASLVYYRRTLISTLTALSLAGGTVTVTTDRPIPGGRAISGRLDVSLQRTDVTGAEGQIRARGTFVVALLSLSSCPQ
jgi:hypothetical protein